ncbi:hypothetical protein Q5424_00870 [Conexibacter sp. JD483]|uniref:hypothetical protein n=1 Tax=unclassified Conexibacter TaxID=2627773 RepID=UPI0027290A9E|nr:MULTISPECIES: hypothetical protein [unclassified Conexibacter]MDO8189036.1 hypothetical protein [Conexibacter sp. CPCC 205706]MDO8198523.1 hypothetical protein [Conexibacter sp. CPCC 205762]MDR9367609.1 hypothetical protein [Conexibacter sp. JD483]
MPTARTTFHLSPAPALALVAAVVAVGAAAPAARAADSAAIARLERIAYNRLGPDALGCAYATDETSPVQLKVTDKAALPAARRIAASMRFSVTVRLIPRRYGLRGMAPVYRGLRKAAEGRKLVAIVRDEATTRPNTCGSATILFTDANAAWAAAQQRRFGSDRVALRLLGPDDPIPL